MPIFLEVNIQRSCWWMEFFFDYWWFLQNSWLSFQNSWKFHQIRIYPMWFLIRPGWWISRAHEFSPYVYLLNICTKYTYILPYSNDPLFCCVISICVNRIDPGLIPRHPKSSKCLVSRCLERWKALKTEMFGGSNTSSIGIWMSRVWSICHLSFIFQLIGPAHIFNFHTHVQALTKGPWLVGLWVIGDYAIQSV